ncbi:uncharacterized protein LOC111406693 [Olea europaea var. sylvestris]|uniref:uncharacterized protein LOC111406693 n=1 Tax=Olea europaea var. sylvestris TaxID=158386 RepID=UPI000C1D3AE2|nr:uncharacterized protein LOC111406693 [Olea europaea var. sylvestris]
MDIINDIRREFGITVSYTKAYMAKNFACGLIRGKSPESYAKLPAYCHILEIQNPSTLTFIHTNDDQHFKYFFMALGPSIHGFLNSMRKAISVDGAFLTSRTKGTLLIATSQDTNFQIYPLALGVVNSENDESWTWFFQKLRLITGDTDDLVIISDHATCIKNGVRNVFRFTHHALCSKKDGIKEYLLEEDFHYWARAHFTGIRYNIMTMNNAESINEKCVTQLTPVGDNLDHYFVNFYEMKCTCRKFDLNKFSCAHAIAAARFKEDDAKANYVHVVTVDMNVVPVRKLNRLT